MDGERTEQSLVPTGDLVSRAEDGNLHIVGRTDNQMKRHGKRVNLRQVEQVRVVNFSHACLTKMSLD